VINGFGMLDQLDKCRQYAKTHGLTIVATYQEDYTGTSIHRPELNKLLDAIVPLQIEVVIVPAVDRLARVSVIGELIEQEFERRGARTLYANATFDASPSGRFQKNVLRAVAEFDRDSLLARLKGGTEAKVKSGSIVAAKPPYGYSIVTERIEGKRLQRLITNDEEAEIVNMIFGWYISDLKPIYKIAQDLTAMGVPTYAQKNGGTYRKNHGWSRIQVRTILNNETYAGMWHYNKTRTTRNANGGITFVPRPREEWLPIVVPAIVSKDVFDLAQQQAIDNKANAKRNRRHDYLFVGRLFCDGCKHRYTGAMKRGKKRYNCNSISEYYLNRCDMPTFSEEELDTAIWRWVCELVQKPEQRRAMLLARQVEADKQHTNLHDRVNSVERFIIEKENELEQLFRERGKWPDKLLAAEKARIETDIADAQRERAELTAKLAAVVYTDEQIQAVDDFCAHLATVLDNATQEKRRKAYAMLNFSARLTTEDGWKIAHCTCILGKRSLDIGPITSTSVCRSTRAPAVKKTEQVCTAIFVLCSLFFVKGKAYVIDRSRKS